MGTLGKSLGTFGAYIAGSANLIEYLLNFARTFVYTTALPPPIVAAASAALRIVEAEPERRDVLRRNAARLKSGLSALGLHVPESSSHIMPVMVGEAAETMRMSQALFEHGVLAQGIRPPTVPEGTARIRVTVMATHNEADIDEAISAFGRVVEMRGVEA